MWRLVPALVAEMGAAYPELVRAQPLIEATLAAGGNALPPDARQRPQAARRSDRGPRARRDACRRDRVQALRHLRLSLRPDRGRAARARARASTAPVSMPRWPSRRRAARAAWKGSGDKASDELWFDLAEEHGATEFIGYSGDEGEGVVLAIVKDGKRGRARRQGRDGPAPAQPDALLRRKRRAGRRPRKTDLAQGLRGRWLRIRRSRWASSTRC